MKIPRPRGRHEKGKHKQGPSIPCPECGGSGKVYNQPKAKRERCTRCGGSGEVRAR